MQAPEKDIKHVRASLWDNHTFQLFVISFISCDETAIETITMGKCWKSTLSYLSYGTLKDFALQGL